jgi:hypothetical protein
LDGRTLFELFPHVQFVDYTKNPALSVLAVVIVVRIAWLMVYRAIVATIRRWRPGLADRMASRDPRGAIVLGWSGMRGLITLATAFALPQQFPGRDLIVLCAFCVVLGTLVIQGFTLLPLMRLLRFDDDAGIERELSRARVAVMQAALDSLDGETSPAATTVREQYAASRKVPKTRTSRKLPPNTTNCGYARSPPNARHCAGCARGARSAKKPFTAYRRSSTGPSSMPRQPEAFNRWRAEAACWRCARGRPNPGSLAGEPEPDGECRQRGSANAPSASKAVACCEGWRESAMRLGPCCLGGVRGVAGVT